MLVLRGVVTAYGWSCLTFCLMGTHYHFVVQTPEPNLAEGMQRLNSRYAISFNRRHSLQGHAFGARYWGEPIERDVHVIEALRYVALNPVRAGIVADPAAWRWSTHGFLSGRCPPRSWVDRAAVLDWFGGRPESYAAFVADGVLRGRTTARSRRA